jgi:hypothetical protein
LTCLGLNLNSKNFDGSTPLSDSFRVDKYVYLSRDV